jgi:hypothetical protein
MNNDKTIEDILSVYLFPEIFADAADILCRTFPLLKCRCFQRNLIKNATFFTMLAVSVSDDEDWDIKIENGIDPEPCISFQQDPKLASTETWEHEVVRHINYTYLEKLIADYANGLRRSRTLKLPKR